MVFSDTMTQTKYRKITAVGDSSICMTIPKKWAHDLGLEKGDFIRIWQDDDKLIVEKAE